jgi:tRNA threonylcarbamoyladenosine biosynthesis protein TsaE
MNVTEPILPFCFDSLGPDETLAAAHSLAQVIPRAGIVVNLIGSLGAGKTHFVKGLAEGLGLDPRAVTSPTFAIVNEYSGEGPEPDRAPRLVHMDFYRLESETALEEVGFIDLLEMESVLAIEWGDRFPNALPADHLEVRIERLGSDSETESVSLSPGEDRSRRGFQVIPRGVAAGRVLERWREDLEKRSIAMQA